VYLPRNKCVTFNPNPEVGPEVQGQDWDIRSEAQDSGSSVGSQDSSFVGDLDDA
jgi:hypothetical protein